MTMEQEGRKKELDGSCPALLSYTSSSSSPFPRRKRLFRLFIEYMPNLSSLKVFLDLDQPHCRESRFTQLEENYITLPSISLSSPTSLLVSVVQCNANHQITFSQKRVIPFLAGWRARKGAPPLKVEYTQGRYMHTSVLLEEDAMKNKDKTDVVEIPSLGQLNSLACRHCKQLLLAPIENKTNEGKKKIKSEEEEGEMVEEKTNHIENERIQSQAALSKKQNESYFTSALAMPSPYWRELSDMWVCHKEDYEGVSGKDIYATAGRCLVSSTCIQVQMDGCPAIRFGSRKLSSSSIVSKDKKDSPIEEGVSKDKSSKDDDEHVQKKQEIPWVHCRSCNRILGEGAYVTLKMKDEKKSTKTENIDLNSIGRREEEEEGKKSLELGESIINGGAEKIIHQGEDKNMMEEVEKKKTDLSPEPSLQVTNDNYKLHWDAKLYRDRICTLSNRKKGREDAFAQDTIETRFCREMLEVLQARLCFTFVLADYDTFKVRLLLQVANPDVAIFQTAEDEDKEIQSGKILQCYCNEKQSTAACSYLCSAATSSSSSSGRFRPAMKLLFQDMSNEQGMLANARGIELIRYREQECDEIVRILIGSNEALPAEFRSMQGKRLGYLLK